MTTKILIVFLFVMGILKVNAQDSSTCVAITSKTLEFLKAGQADSVVKFFDKTMEKSLTAESLNQIWAGLQTSAGQLKSIEKTKITPYDKYFLSETSLVFEGRTFKYRLSFDSDNKISGMYFVPLKVNKKNKTLVENDVFIEVETYVKSGNIKLPAIYCRPKNMEDFPVAVLVHGSGPNDMDETLGPNKIFLDIAHGLANQGIATLRYDKRTYLASQNMDTSIKITGLDNEVIIDALAAVELASRLEGANPNKVFVIGHSLGAMLAPEIARRSAKVHGIVLMAGPSGKLQDLLQYQYNYIFNLDGKITKDEKKALKELKKQIKNLEKMKSWQPKGKVKPLPLTQDTLFWRNVLEYDQVLTLKNLHKPALILNGERDYQVVMEQFDGWKKGLGTPKNVSYKSYPGLNHHFILGEGKPNPQEYSKRGNVSDETLSDISVWIKAN